MNTIPKFKTTRGKLTVYAFKCGYKEVYHNNDNRVTLELDCIWQVKSRVAGQAAWISFAYADRVKAIKYFNSIKKQLKLLLKEGEQ